jgi:nucleotide-binding universal stress UspA family protein
MLLLSSGICSSTSDETDGAPSETDPPTTDDDLHGIHSPCYAEEVELMAIRKILLPLQVATTAAAAFSAAAMVARLWRAHLAVLHSAVSRDQERAVHDLFETLTAAHGLAVAEARPDANEATVSFAAVIGREPDVVVAHQARLADLIVVPHPAGDKEVSSSGALHAVLFDSAKPVLIAPRTAPSTIGQHICIAWNGTAESASAVITALPWLQRAQSIRILWSEDYQRRGPLAPDLQQYLAAYDLTADRAAFQPINKVVGAGLLAAANEFACDLLVMGAYSHSRLRQLILGGVTRHVLEHATVPVMMHR